MKKQRQEWSKLIIRKKDDYGFFFFSKMIMANSKRKIMGGRWVGENSSKQTQLFSSPKVLYIYLCTKTETKQISIVCNRGQL